MPCLQHMQGDKNWQLVMQERDPKLVALQQICSQFLFLSLRTAKHLRMLELLCALIILSRKYQFSFTLPLRVLLSPTMAHPPATRMRSPTLFL